MIKNKIISEKYILKKYLTKLTFNKDETFQLNNDAAYLNLPSNKHLIVTNDTILESVDFFKNDSPESIANKIVTCNLSDISAMGACPYCYTLSLSIPKNINEIYSVSFGQ